jgi:hypothetical protein
LNLYDGFVANKSDFTAEQWDLLRKAPLFAGMIVMAASPSGPIGVLKESFAASAALRNGLDAAQGELTKLLAIDLRQNINVHKADSFDPDALRSEALAVCREVSVLLSQKATEQEASEFKTWLLSIAREVAQAAREGGFLGFGGVEITEAEASTIDQLEIALR